MLATTLKPKEIQLVIGDQELLFTLTLESADVCMGLARLQSYPRVAGQLFKTFYCCLCGRIPLPPVLPYAKLIVISHWDSESK